MAEETIKERIKTYMEFNGFSYQRMAEELELELDGEEITVQSFHRWLNNPQESFSSKVERAFNNLVK